MPEKFVDGRPVSPQPGAAVQRGRNGFGLWGENAMADALVTATWQGSRYVLLIERGDGAGWAVPGGKIDPGETPADAAVRELAEETGLTVPAHLWQAGTPRFVPDGRGSDEAWAVTVVARADLGTVAELPEVHGGDDARRATWFTAPSYSYLVGMLRLPGGRLFPAHVAMLKEALGTARRKPASLPASPLPDELREVLTGRGWTPWGGDDILAPPARGRAARADGVHVEILDDVEPHETPVSVFLPGAGQTVRVGPNVPLEVVLKIIDAACEWHGSPDARERG